MGGRLRFMLVGSAPLAENVLTFTRCALGCLVGHNKKFVLIKESKMSFFGEGG